MNSWFPIVLLGALASGFAVVSVVASRVIGPRRYNRTKLESYECGIEPTGSITGSRFPMRYSVTAMLFIVFDVEIVFLYPWAVTSTALGVFGLVEMLLFMLPVFIAYLYVRRRGGLNWT